nr:B3 domain-containing protein Os03g0212300-like [Lolium perenne]
MLAIAFDAVVFIGEPLGIQRLSDKFADFVANNELAVLHLREASCDYCRWPVDMLFDGRAKMYLHTGWEKFARYHDLEAGCVLAFSYLGDADMSVKVFDDTRCRHHYHSDTDEDND